MTTEAANALLKTLEEPPPGACLILIASDPDALLPTVRSRCRLVPFLLPVPSSPRTGGGRLDDARRRDDGWRTLSGGRPGRALTFDLAAYRAGRDAMMEVIARLAERRPGRT